MLPRRCFLLQRRLFRGNFSQSSVISSGLKCWKCGTDRQTAELFCGNCKVIQTPAERKNYFKLFNYQTSYEIDLKDLRLKYRRMQSFLHPDKFTNRSKEEKTISEDYSSLVNKAYNTLQSPLSRALHLLSLHNERIGEEDKASDPAFLMEIMELNEEVDGARSAEALTALNVKNRSVLDALGKEILGFFEKGEVVKAKDCVVKMKYYDSLGKRINGLLRERGIVDD